jgi:thiamine pyrophosphokinase
MRVLILANGESPSQELAQQLAAEHDWIVATDGAAHRAVGLELLPRLICGDFDSVVLEVARQEFPDAEFLPTPDQDFADLEKAIRIAIERGATEITIVGAHGGRIDFTLANAALLLRYQAEVSLRIVDDAAEIRVVGSPDDTLAEITFSACPGETISLLSFSGTVRASIAGVRWPLDDFLLPIGTHGVSNVAVTEQVTVRARGGSLLVVHFTNSALTQQVPTS